ncbi:Dam family site-specific DNA-(adenine-N6)-methyltransferase [Ruthenibacterium lactatiformans]|uniref:Dam family site-specific DNA-(adenine-N6)-methyltransferase n=1 Tax=Ruthenibacterium lactatiformans TaxID=1550024 RepID=UPI001967B0FB|nr:Dam family site-specific DNA-(adenine-N6)-methyltransferase [Ruthenibacterium lactatiformans]MBN3013642.1 Dam family site-specific DNA-(adenine-N6)-methyltransferase [Ruthenibacterium lactatiformans]
MSIHTTTQYRRSPFFYVGDKFKLLSQLEENFPKDIDRFIEPFCGGGSVFLNTDANQYLLNDIDSYMIQLHEFLMSYAENQEEFWNELKKYILEYNLSATFLDRNVPEQLRKEFKKTYFAKYNKEAYTKLRSDFNVTKDNMMQLYMLLIYGFNRMLRFNGKGDFNLPVGNVDFNKNVVNALNDYFDYVADKDIIFFNTDFEEFVKEIEPTKDDFVYLDPPYLITFSEYNKLWNEDSEMRLIRFLDELDDSGIRFAVSNVLWHRKRYNGTFNEWAQKYNIVQIESNYISYHDNTEKNSIEVLVKNY